MWCIQAITPEYRERMYDLLDLYAEPYDPLRPVICTDEKSKQLLAHSRTSLPMKAGRPERQDYEYKRHGTRNIFMAVEPKGGRRIVSVTRRRTRKDFARFIKYLLDAYPQAERIRLVLDNLNTHFAKSFIETFPETHAEILQKIEFHYTPKHASWLNMAELEINILDRECLGKRRIPNDRMLEHEAYAWADRRNAGKRTIQWRFTREKADKILSKHYIA